MDINQIYKKLCHIPSDINEHLPTLKQYASECRVIVELGMRDGVSTWALLAGKPKEMVSIDIIFPKVDIDLYKITRAEGIEYYFWLGSSLEVKIPCDLLFVDTIHTYDQLSKELKLWGNHVEKYIILHDTTSCKEELEPAVNEFLEQNKQWSIDEVFENNNGLTILKHG